MLQEYQGFSLLTKEGIKVPSNVVACSAQEALEGAKKLSFFLKINLEKIVLTLIFLECKDYVLKAQVLTGGRGKGVFDSGLKGGVQIVYTLIFWVFI